MDYQLSQAVVKSGKRDPPFWLIGMGVGMLASVCLFAVLPPYLGRDNYDKFDMEVVVNHGVNETFDNHYHVETTGNVATDKVPGNTDNEADPDKHTVTKTQSNTVVRTPHGDIRGTMSNGVRVFHGVPYARPPVGLLRWEPPQEVAPWQPKMYDATVMRSGCPQRCTWHQYCPRNTSEDCLYLEIYTPVTASPASKLPVEVYLHGGSFQKMSATSSIYDASYVVKRTGIVVVLVDYRIGALGFLVQSDGFDGVMGNYGLLDQAMALHWVQANVEAFGGDREKVTLAGQSAGSESSLIHLQSPETSKTFRSLILESPPISLPLKTADEGLKQSRAFARMAGCFKSETDSETHGLDLACLKNLNTEAILDAQYGIRTFGSGYLSKFQPWGPIVDNKVVHSQLLKSFEAMDHNNHKSILVGVTEEEALLFVREWLKQPTGRLLYSFAKSKFAKGLDPTRFKTLYPGDAEDSRDDIAVVATDFLFRCPLQFMAETLHENGIDTFWTFAWHKTLILPKGVFGYMCSGRSCHGVEIPYVFHNFADLGTNTTDADLQISDRIIDYYASFVKFGDPNGEQAQEKNPDSDLVAPLWPKAYATGRYRTLGFQKNGSIHTEDGGSEDRCRLWIEKDFRL